jgi:UDP-N-acetylglucosamine 2-epimerase (non-hydrolysing)
VCHFEQTAAWSARQAEWQRVSNLRKRHTVACVVGTRPEVIKMAPVIREFGRRPSRFDTVLVSTGQHRQLLAQAFAAFDLHPDVDLGLMGVNQPLGDFAGRSLVALSDALPRLQPSMVLVQGDTSTALTAALAACYQHIPVGHVEAGLRSFDTSKPFPEEINRALVGVLADVHFAPTESARRNLLRSLVPANRILVTGNTVVDAVQSMPDRPDFDDPQLQHIASLPGRLIVVTIHRRENHGLPLRRVCAAIRELAPGDNGLRIAMLVHPNPEVEAALVAALHEVKSVYLVPPASYGDMLRLMRRSFLILSDSGGIQEEAPSLGKPLLILRDVTERPEVVEVGAAKLVGTSGAKFVAEIRRLLDDPVEYRRMQRAPNPFGDGRAAARIVEAIGLRLSGARCCDLSGEIREWRHNDEPATAALSGVPL